MPVGLVAPYPLCSCGVRAILRLFLRGTPMFDEMWQEIQDAPGEIFDIPELRDEEDFNMNEYLNGNYDY